MECSGFKKSNKIDFLSPTAAQTYSKVVSKPQAEVSSIQKLANCKNKIDGSLTVAP